MMKQNLKLVVIAVILISLSGCTPHIITHLTKVYPPIATSDDVTIYEQGDTIPEYTDSIGHITVNNKRNSSHEEENGLQVACRETARRGGNGLLITRNGQPSKWNNDPEIEGTMLRIPLENECSANPIFISEFRKRQKIAREEMIKKHQAPSNTFSFSIGPGLIYSKIYTPAKTYKHKTGIDWKLEYNRISRKGLGFGLLYSGFRTQFPGEYIELGNDQKKLKMLLAYIAPAFVGRFRIDEWLLKFGLGIGYARYNDGGSDLITGVGFHTDFGCEYKISRYIGLGISMSAIDFYMSKQIGMQYADGERSGILRWNIQTSLHYYF